MAYPIKIYINIHTWRERERLRLLTMHTIEADTYKQPASLLLNPREGG
jgi:hypothetical protein